MREKMHKWEIFFRKKYLYIILVILSIMIITLCMQDTINYDEYFSMQWCRLNWKELLGKLMDDVHPPLYYFMLKPLLDLSSENMFCARLLSAAASISLLWSGSLFLDRFFGKKSALLFIFLLYFNPFMVQKVTEVRMYSLAGTFTVASGIMSYLILKNPIRKNWILFAFFSLLAAYTHYYALLSMVFLYVGILIYFVAARYKKGLRNWLLCSCATAIGYFPWLPVALKQITSVNQGFWIETPSSRLGPLRELFYTMTPYTEHIYLGIIFLLTAISLLLFLQKRSLASYWSLMCCSALWGTLLLTTWYSSQIRPILLSRYLIMALCLSVIGICGTAQACHKYIVFIICLYCTIIGGSLYIRYIEGAVTQRNTTKTVAFANENFEENDLILYDMPLESSNNYFELCIEYYFPNVSHIDRKESSFESLEQKISETGGSVWYLDTNGSLSPDELVSENFQAENFGNYGFSSVTFEIYRIELHF